MLNVANREKTIKSAELIRIDPCDPWLGSIIETEYDHRKQQRK